MWTNKDILNSFIAQEGHKISKDELGLKMPHMVPLVLFVDTDYVDHLLSTDFAQFMFFVTKGTQFTIVAPDAETAAKIERFLSLSYEGPRSAELSASVAAEYPADVHGVPDMMAELTRGFGNSPPLHVLRKVVSLDDRGEYAFAAQGVTVRKVGTMQYEIIDGGQSLGVVNLKDYPLPKSAIQVDPELQEVRQRALIEGRPGLWAIGTGHGFANEETSGFIIFGQGKSGSGKIILVDPPSSTPDYLLANGIPLEAVEGVILTHGHTDHYGDAIPKLLKLMPQVKIYTTPTVQKMLQEQYELGVGGKREGITQWNFVPVRPQTFMEILGLQFRFEYGFHTVPTIGFDIYDKPDLAKGKCIAFFTGDTFADYSSIWPHTKEGPNQEPPNQEPPVMSVQRALNVTRHYAHIMASKGQQPPIVGLIEGGFPPIHTPPLSTKNLLEAADARGIDVSNVRVYHIDQKTANDANVPKWQPGPKGFIDLSPAFPEFIPTTELEYAARILDKMPLLDELGSEMKAAILRNGTLKKVPAGTSLIHDGVADAHDRKFYFLIDGEVQVSKDGTVITSRPNGMFGEGALLGRDRNADVTTSAPSLVLEVDVMDLPPRVSGPLKAVLQQVRYNRGKAYGTIKNHSPLGILPDSILDVLFMRPKTFTIQDGFTFIQEGAMDRDVYVVLDGHVRVSNESQTVHEVLGKGAMLGEMALVDGKPRAASVTAMGDVTVIKWAADVLQSLGTKYPGIAIAMGRTAERREAENGAGIRVTVTPGKSETGFVTPDVFLTPVYAAKRGADFLDEITPAVMKTTLRGGLVFLLGDQLSEMALGKFHMPDVKSLTVDYAALTAGGRLGELGLKETLSLKMAQGISPASKMVLGRMVPLFSALVTQEFVHNGKVDLAQLPLSAGNVLVASGIVSGATAVMGASETVLNLGKVLRLVSAGSKATLLGAVISSAAEFTIIKGLNQMEARMAESASMASIIEHLSQLLCADAHAIEMLSHGQTIPAGYFEAIDQQLSTYEEALVKHPSLEVRQVEADYAASLADLKERYTADVSRPLDGTFSRSEVTEKYEARRRKIEADRDAALATARAAENHRFTPLAVEPNQVADQLLDTVDEDTYKADVDMDGNPLHEAQNFQYQAVLARDWKTLSAQIAQYRKDRATVIEKYQRQLQPKALPIELAMN
jgi:CRP-like cAMP-binding protein